MVITKTQINNFVLFTFLLICIFFPADPYNIKIVALFILLCLNAGKILAKIGATQYRVIMMMGVIYPIVIIMQSILLTRNIGASISGAYSPVILLLMIPIIEGKLAFKKYVIFLLKIMAISILLIAFADIIGIYDVNGHGFIRTSFYSYGMGVMGKSHAYSSYYRIFYKASPLLVLLLDDAIFKRDYKWVAISFGALWFTGTRANVFSALIILFFRHIVWTGKKNNNRAFIGFIMVVFLITIAPRFYNMIIGQMNTSGAIASDLVRSGLIQSYMNEFSDPLKFAFGSGFGAPFFNYGRGTIGYTSELSYFEIVRCVGIFLAVPFFVFVFRPVFSRKIPTDYKLSFICYLIIAATNPLLFSSTAMIMYLYFYENIIEDGRLHIFQLKDEQIFPRINLVIRR